MTYLVIGAYLGRSSPTEKTINVSLKHTLERFVNRQVATGRYQTASEVVRDALRLLDEQSRLRETKLRALRKDLQRGIDDIEAGRYQEFDRKGLKKLAEDVKRRGRQRLAQRIKRRAS